MTTPITQTGVSTAVGLTIESAWGQVPVTVSTGAAVIGITGTNPERFFVVEASGGLPGKVKVDVPKNELDGDIQPGRSIKTASTYDGDFDFKVDPENVYYPLLGIFGTDIQTTTEAGSTGDAVSAYQHIFKVGKLVPSFSVEEILGIGISGRLSTGVLINKLDFTFNDVVTAKVSMYAQHQIPNTYLESGAEVDYDFTNSPAEYPIVMGRAGANTLVATASPTFVDIPTSNPGAGGDGNGPLVFASMVFGSQSGFSSAFITVDGEGVAVDFLPGMTLSLDRNITVQMVGGSGFDIGACTANEFSATGKIKFLYSDNTLTRALQRHSTIGINFRLQGINIGSPTPTPYFLEVYIPRASLTQAPLQLTDKEMMIDCDFDCRKDPSTGCVAMITIANTFTNVSLGGTVGDTPGGLGGWVNS